MNVKLSGMSTKFRNTDALSIFLFNINISLVKVPWSKTYPFFSLFILSPINMYAKKAWLVSLIVACVLDRLSPSGTYNANNVMATCDTYIPQGPAACHYIQRRVV